jgi:hypothetical protein
MIRFAPEGRPFIAVAWIVALVLAALGRLPTGREGADRRSEETDGGVASPAGSVAPFKEP